MRPIDLTSGWNRAILALTFVAGAIGLALTIWLDRDLFLAVAAGGSTFLSWALARELDPDRQLSAIVAAVAGGVLALAGMPTALLPYAALLMSARLIAETTGRRPLPTDIGAMVILATVISFTPLGWVMGFGLAIAIYVDDRMADVHSRRALLGAIAGAVGASAVITLTDALPESLPVIRPLLAAIIGILTLTAWVREPVEPVSFVDSRNKRFLRKDRLHAARATAGLLIFVGGLVSGEAAGAVVAMAVVLGIALVSSEIERFGRRRRG